MTEGKGSVRIAVASGKGGTGKTTVAVNLAIVAARRGMTVVYADCDVEEPNGHIYLHPRIERAETVTIQVPAINPELCDGCRLCVRICAFHAIVALPDQVLVFSELCHGCGGCRLVCPAGAITEVPRERGIVETGIAGIPEGLAVPPRFINGRLNIGEAIHVPVVRAVKGRISPADAIFIDCPPGNACALVESAAGSDLLLLVTEPTPFGAHDLDRVLDTATELSLSSAVVINRAGPADRIILDLCARRGVPVLARISESREWAEAGSRGLVAALVIEEAEPFVGEILDAVLETARRDKTVPGQTTGRGAAP